MMKINVQPTPPFNVGPGPQEVGPIFDGILLKVVICFYFHYIFRTTIEKDGFVDFPIYNFN